MALMGFRAPALPLPGPGYDPRQQAELVRSLRLYFNLLDSLTPQQAQSYTADQFNGGAFNGDFGTFNFVSGFGNGLEMPYAMLMSDQNQANAGATSENLLSYNQIVLSNGITVENGTRIKFPYSGQYLITFSLQVVNKDNVVHEFEVWAKNSGTNYPLSNSRIDVPARKSVGVWGHALPAVSGIFTVQSDEYLEIAWWGETTDVSLEYYTARTSPDRPAIPPVILTVNFVCALPRKFFPEGTGTLSVQGYAPTISIA